MTTTTAITATTPPPTEVPMIRDNRGPSDEEFSFKVVGVENIAFSSRVLDVEGGVADGFVVSVEVIVFFSLDASDSEADVISDDVE